MNRILLAVRFVPFWVLLGALACTPASRQDVCEGDGDCADRERCKDGVCVAIECTHSGDCPSGKYCVDGFCINNVACQSDADCVDPTPVCDLDSGLCVDCVPDCIGKCCGQDGCGAACDDNCADTGQTCNDQSCECEGVCQPDCAGKQCGPDGCGETCAPGCDPDQFCDGQGRCASVGCASDGDCTEPTPICDVGNRVCVQCLISQDCEVDQICSGGLCAQESKCTDNGQCEMSQICLEGDCVAGCESNRDCPGELTCLPDEGPNGLCAECEQVGDCGAGQTCENFQCVAHCTNDNHCTPQYCDQATHDCVVCTDDAHCAAGEICESFSCREGCRLDDDCPSGHCDLNSNICLECLSNDDCPLGSVCIGQQCVVGCTGDRDCPGDLQCDLDLGDHGTCVECVDDLGCQAGYRCVVGLCEFFCTGDGDCADPRPACGGDGVCVECTTSDHCAEGTICVSQVCLPGCASDRDCPPLMVCNPDQGDHGGCVECNTDADCLSGYTCDGDRCIIEGTEMVRLPGGNFVRGSDAGEGETDEEPESTVVVPTFYMDRTEVTNDQYRACVQSGNCSAPLDRAAYDNPALGNHPVTYVSWDQASSFCSWMDKSLPTEARWERAARGTVDEREYPWGAGSPDCSRANYLGCHGQTRAVGSTPAGASAEGVYDLAGNVYEWVYDRYGETYYTDGGTDDPFGPTEGDYRGIRGGGYDSPASNIRTANRAGRMPDTADPDVGFRCSMRGLPVAGFTVAPEQGPYESTTFSVDASVSTDPNHPTSLLEVHWDWEDDDIWDTTWTTAKAASHRYAFNGIFRIRVEVRDPDGNVSSTSQEVVAEGPGGWDQDACEEDQDCAHGFTCIFDMGVWGYVCRESCVIIFDETCHIPNRTCQFLWCIP